MVMRLAPSPSPSHAELRPRPPGRAWRWHPSPPVPPPCPRPGSHCRCGLGSVASASASRATAGRPVAAVPPRTEHGPGESKDPPRWSFPRSWDPRGRRGAAGGDGRWQRAGAGSGPGGVTVTPARHREVGDLGRVLSPAGRPSRRPLGGGGAWGGIRQGRPGWGRCPRAGTSSSRTRARASRAVTV